MDPLFYPIRWAIARSNAIAALTAAAEHEAKRQRLIALARGEAVVTCPRCHADAAHIVLRDPDYRCEQCGASWEHLPFDDARDTQP